VLNAGTWFHIVCTYDGSGDGNGMTIYVSSVANNPTTSTISGSILNNNPITIGAASVGANKINGQIDELLIFDFELSETQVQFLAGN